MAPYDGDYLALQRFDNNIKINIYMHINTITYDVAMFVASSSDTESAVVPVGSKSSETDGKKVAAYYTCTTQNCKCYYTKLQTALQIIRLNYRQNYRYKHMQYTYKLSN